MRSKSFAICASLMFVVAEAGWAQNFARHDTATLEQVRSLLREASRLATEVDEIQRPSVVANIASRQVMAGDLEGALKTAWIEAKPEDRSSALSTMAYVLADQGNSAMAFRLIADSDPRSHKENGYLQLAGLLAEKGDFQGALKAAHFIEGEPGQTTVFVDTLMRIYSRQSQIKDQPGAAETLAEAMDAVERDTKTTERKATIIALYQSIATYLAESGDHEAARELVYKIEDLGGEDNDPWAKQVFLRSLAAAQATTGDILDAYITTDKLDPGQDRDSILSLIAMEEAKHGKQDDAFEVAAAIESGPNRLITLRSIADEEATSGNYAKALSTIDANITAPGDRAYALAELAIELAEKSDPAAPNAVDLAWNAAQVAGDQAEPFVLEFIAVTRGLLGDFTGAIDIINGLDGKDRPWPLWNVTAMMAFAGKTDDALALAQAQEAPHARAYGLLGTANGLLKIMADKEKK